VFNVILLDQKNHPLKNGLVRYCGRAWAEKSLVVQEVSAADIDLNSTLDKIRIARIYCLFIQYMYAIKSSHLYDRTHTPPDPTRSVAGCAHLWLQAALPQDERWIPISGCRLFRRSARPQHLFGAKQTRHLHVFRQGRLDGWRQY
jgi:hypothetical protein